MRPAKFPDSARTTRDSETIRFDAHKIAALSETFSSLWRFLSLSLAHVTFETWLRPRFR